MSLPQTGDYIDIHIHSGTPAQGIFILESLMAHEEKVPVDAPGIAYTYGIHPWFLDESNQKGLLAKVEKIIPNADIIAIGEAGFDRLRGPSLELQSKVFESQVAWSESLSKPIVIHCVRAWDELLLVRKKMKPKMPWLVHGFRGGVEMANQLLSKGMYLSLWFDFVLRPESSNLIRILPHDKIFLETDGADVNIRHIYRKVSKDLGIEVESLKGQLYTNYYNFFKLKT